MRGLIKEWTKKMQFNLKFIVFFIVFITWKIPLGYSSESSAYDFNWLDPDKEVYVLQNKKFRKKGRPYFNLGAGLTTSSAFSSGQNLHGRVGLFFFEEWGVEVFYSKNFFGENETALSVKSAGSVPFSRNVESYLGGMLLWAPFYAKINTFNKIFYFDWIFGAGVAKLDEENNRNHLEAGNTLGALTKESHTGLILDTGLRLYLSESFNVRADLVGLYYSARSALKTSAASETSLYTHYDLTLSIGYSF